MVHRHNKTHTRKSSVKTSIIKRGSSLTLVARGERVQRALLNRNKQSNPIESEIYSWTDRPIEAYNTIDNDFIWQVFGATSAIIRKMYFCAIFCVIGCYWFKLYRWWIKYDQWKKYVFFGHVEYYRQKKSLLSSIFVLASPFRRHILISVGLLVEIQIIF